MTELLTITSERVDDLPLLLAQMEGMERAALLDAHFLTHGGWEGRRLGAVSVVWLTHVLSQADHRLNVVQPWVESGRETLAGQPGPAGASRGQPGPAGASRGQPGPAAALAGCERRPLGRRPLGGGAARAERRRA